MEYWVELITNMGVPIAAMIAMAWFIYNIYKRSEKREDELREQITKSQEVNAQAIETLTLYAERLTVIESDVKDIKNKLE